MDAPPLRWGILGTGWIAAQFTHSVQSHTRQAIAAVGSRSRDQAMAFADTWDIPAALESYAALVHNPDIDIVYVASPHNHHHDHVLMALDAGKHVLVEKPIALNRAQAAAMVGIARSRGLFLAEALWSRFLPKFDVLDQIVEAGIIGDIRSIYTEYGEYLPPSHRAFDPALAGGPLLDLGTYPISLISRLLGVPDGVAGFGQSDPSGVNGQLAVAMQHRGGALSTMATTLYGFTPTNAVLVGTRGTIRFGSPFHLPGPFEIHSRDGGDITHYREPPASHFEGLYFQAAEVARCIDAGLTQSPRWTWDDSLASMATLDTIRAALGIDFAEAGLVEA